MKSAPAIPIFFILTLLVFLGIPSSGHAQLWKVAREESEKQAQIKQAADEAKCTPVDLRNLAIAEIRDQDSIGWCYAFAAADLLSYKLNRVISAADIAIRFNANKFPNIVREKLAMEGLKHEDQDLEGGYVDQSIELMQKGGVCLEENFKSEDNGFSNLHATLEMVNILSKINKLESCASVSNKLFPNLKNEDIYKILEGANKADYIRLISDKACEPRINIKDLKVTNKSVDENIKPQEIFDLIDSQFNKGNIVGIGFLGSLLNDRNSFIAKTEHATTVVGRRFNKSSGQCEYLIRNSYGRSCNGYDKSYSCEEGNIWVPKSVLKRGLISATYIE